MLVPVLKKLRLTLPPAIVDTRTLRRFRVLKSYIVTVALAARSPTAKYLRLALMHIAQIPSVSCAPGKNCCVLVSGLYSTMLWPAVNTQVCSSSQCRLSAVPLPRPKICLQHTELSACHRLIWPDWPLRGLEHRCIRYGAQQLERVRRPSRASGPAYFMNRRGFECRVYIVMLARFARYRRA